MDTYASSYLPEFILSKTSSKKFLPCNTQNGYILNDVQLPEEVLICLLSKVNPAEILKCRLVCQNWNYLLTSFPFWAYMYRNKYKRKPKKLPWYLYYCLFSSDLFERNLLKNGNGQEGLKHWRYIETTENDLFEVEKQPFSVDPLPKGVPDFCNQLSCFASNSCYVVQVILLGKSNLFNYILNNYKPHIYLSEWVASGCSCKYSYKLQCRFWGPRDKYSATISCTVRTRHWEKVEMCIMNYPEEVNKLLFEYLNCDKHYIQCDYGSKRAGGVVKLMFDSIEPLPTNENGTKKPKRFNGVVFDTNINRTSSAIDSSEYWGTPEFIPLPPPPPPDYDFLILVLIVGSIPTLLILILQCIFG